MAALTNAQRERYCQYRGVTGTPGGKSKTVSIYAAIMPSTSTSDYEAFRGLISTETEIATRLTELGGETSP